MWPNPCQTTPAWSVHDRCLVGMVVPSFSWECWLQCIYYKSLWFNGWPFPCSGWESPVLTMVHLGASFWETLCAELEDGYDMRSDTPYRRFIVRWSEDNVPTTMILGGSKADTETEHWIKRKHEQIAMIASHESCVSILTMWVCRIEYFLFFSRVVFGRSASFSTWTSHI